MKKINVIIVIIFLLISHNGLCITKQIVTDVVISNSKLTEGKVFDLHSKILNQKREIHIYRPSGYEDSTKKYPVLYVLDAEHNFYQTTAIVDKLSSSKRIPEMIVVGISSINKTNRIKNFARPSRVEMEQKYSANGFEAEKFIQFINEELTLYIDKQYRTIPFRILAGASLTAHFTVDVLLSEPDIFDAYIAASPVIGWDNERSYEKAEKIFLQQKSLDKYLYLSMATETMGNHKNITLALSHFVELLKNKAPDNFNWTFKHYPEENHSSIPLQTYIDALLKLYQPWRPPYFKNVADFKKKGGIDFVNKNYMAITKLGYKKQKFLPENQMMNIATLYRREKKFAELKEFITSNKENISSNMLRRIGEWFIHWPEGYEQESIFYFKRWAKLSPSESAPFLAISWAYFDMNKLEMSAKYRSKANEVQQANPDPDFEAWKARYVTIK